MTNWRIWAIIGFMSTFESITEVRQTVRAVATMLLPELPAIGAGISEYICARLPEFEEANATDVVLATCQANATVVLDSLIRGVDFDALKPSTEVVQSTYTLVQVGLPLAVVMRSYRIGSQYWIDRWARAVAEYGQDGEVSIGAVTEGISFLLSWLESITESLAEEYRNETLRLAHERSFARADDIRHVLTDRELDVDSANTRLGYRINGRHVAVILRDCTDRPRSDTALNDAVNHLARAIGAPSPLVAHVDARTTWCWLACSGEGPIRLPAPRGPVLAAQGRPGRGLVGFRRSHREAVDALRVAEIVRRPSSTIMFYDDVDIVSMCSVNPELSAQFIDDELGPLAANDPRTRLQRHTLEAFFAANSNYRAAAAALGVHHNTVRYRLDQAERVLGRGLGERRLALELALHLASTLQSVSDDDSPE